MDNEIRTDIFGRSVILASKRLKRPGHFNGRKDSVCPFCPGMEDNTEKTILTLPNESNWKVRVFPNKFPVLTKKRFRPVHENFFSTYTPSGIHELLVESREHDKDYDEMAKSDILLVLEGLMQRYENLMKIEDVNYVTIFKNMGKAGGASLEHPHTQIIAAPLFPDEISRQMDESEEYYKKERECGNCVILENEIKKRKRMILKNRHWAVYAPFASIWPYETVIIPRRHFSEMTEMKTEEMTSLAGIMKKIFAAYSRVLRKPPYNMMYYNFPRSDFWHFQIRIFPRLVTRAGFEFFGLNVNTKPPEDAARDLKKAIK